MNFASSLVDDCILLFKLYRNPAVESRIQESQDTHIVVRGGMRCDRHMQHPPSGVTSRYLGREYSSSAQQSLRITSTFLRTSL